MTIAQQLNITEFPFTIKDDNGRRIYHENRNGDWTKWVYDQYGNEIYYENSNGYVLDNRHENNQPEKWYKIFAPMWNDGKGNTIRYEISFIRADELHKISDYKILEEYSDKGMMLNGL
jgi:hypothetical protein